MGLLLPFVVFTFTFKVAFALLPLDEETTAVPMLEPPLPLFTVEVVVEAVPLGRLLLPLPKAYWLGKPSC